MKTCYNSIPKIKKAYKMKKLQKFFCVAVSLIGFQAAVAADIVIDAGHGGRDPGAVRHYKGKLRLEKDYTLDMSKQLEREFKRKGYSVSMTRRTDKSVSLQSRLNQARRECKQLFLSVHADSALTPSARGVTAYAGANNHVNGKRSMELARQVQNAFQPVRKARTERFFVLKNLSCPTLLVEMGFITNNKDLDRLMNAKERNRMVSKLGNALHIGLQKQRAANSKPTTKPKNTATKTNRRQI